jgi:hypothetical protein
VRGEELLKCGAIDVVAQISNIKLLAHLFSSGVGRGPVFYFPDPKKKRPPFGPKKVGGRGEQVVRRMANPPGHPFQSGYQPLVVYGIGRVGSIGEI